MRLYITEQGAVLDRKIRRALTKAAKAATKENKGAISASLMITDDENIRMLNKQYRDIDKETDVLSFPSGEDGFLGDIAISLPRAVKQAKMYGHSLEREMAFLTAHGMLHLLGYDHENEKDEKEMRDKQREILENAGYHLL